MQRRNLIVQNHIRTIKRGDKKGGVDTMVNETIRSIKEAEQQAEVLRGWKSLPGHQTFLS